jgi:apolipoprotein N-acyltransferase
MVSRRELALSVAAAGLGAVLFLLGTGLTPVWWATWLAPLPVLLAAPRIAAPAAGIAAFAAWLGGEAGMWAYYTSPQALSQPRAFVAVLFIAIAAVFAAVVLGARALIRSGRPVAAALFVPSAWTAVEFAVSRATPNGLFWSLAYTQVDVLPVLQTASLTGAWGITFLVTGLPAVVAVIGSAGPLGRRRLALAGAALVLFASVLGYGAWRLRSTDSDPAGVRVAVAAVEQPFDPVALGSGVGGDLLARDLEQIRSLAAAGAGVVVLPEKGFTADDTTLPVVTDAFAAAAVREHVTVVVGLVLTHAGVTHNAALVFGVDDGPVEYDKHHLIPVLEDAFTPGDRITVVERSGLAWGVTICKDLDYPTLIRRYRQDGAQILLAPGWDFDRDAWLHSRMAVMRGVENGLPLARAARNGAVTITDPYGRVLAEQSTLGRSVASGTAIVAPPAPAPPYTRLGDWFAWTCTLGLAAGLVLLLLGRLRTRRSTNAARRAATPRTTADSPALAGPPQAVADAHRRG